MNEIEKEGIGGHRRMKKAKRTEKIKKRKEKRGIPVFRRTASSYLRLNSCSNMLGQLGFSCRRKRGRRKQEGGVEE
jgi:hypothetical protein